MRAHTGFTLIEVIIVMVLIGIIAGVIGPLLANGFNAYLAGVNASDADWQGLLSLERMSRDIQAIRSPADIVTATASQLTFTDTTGNSVSYQLSGGNLQRNSQIIANGVAGLTFSYFDANGASTATLTAIRYVSYSLNITQKGANFNLSSAVYPRNLL